MADPKMQSLHIKSISIKLSNQTFHEYFCTITFNMRSLTLFKIGSDLHNYSSKMALIGHIILNIAVSSSLYIRQI